MRADEMQQIVADFGAIGATASGGVTRPGLTDLERAALERARAWMVHLGMDAAYDHVGNLRGTWAGARPDAAPVLTGSHLDSVVEGGRYDGAAGVLCALAAVETLRAQGHTPERPLGVCVFTSEEGSRFGPGLLGSTALVRGLTADQLGASGDDGVTVARAIAEAGGDPGAAAAPALAPGAVHAFIEVHIEQASRLEEAGAPVGIVSGIAGPLFARGVVTGVADHAGATPMGQRADALCGLAELVLAVERTASAADTTVATVGSARAHPGQANIIPGRAEFSLDLRDVDLSARDHAEAEIRAVLDELTRRRGLHGELEVIQREPPVAVDPQVVAALETAVAGAGLDLVRVPSGAAHDAMIMADIAPIGMLFVRCRGGLSHCPQEYASPEDLVAASDVLARALAQLT